MDTRLKVAAVVAALVLAAGVLLYTQRSSSTSYEPYKGPLAAPGKPGTAKTRHLTLNTEAKDHPKLRELGYDLVDIKPADLAAIPQGAQAMLWVGNFTCDDFELSFPDFTAAVRRLGKDPRVFGWYLSDEPDPGRCPEVADEIRRRADFLRQHAPGQRSFISLTDWPMKPVAPKNTHVDLIGLDPYPCKGGTTAKPQCDINAIDRMVLKADAAGIPRAVIVPVFQTFGQACSNGDKQYWLPSPDQLQAMLTRWDRLAPRPPLDIAYSWGHQAKWACPTLADSPALQTLLKTHNGVAG